MKIEVVQNKSTIDKGDLVNYKGELCFVFKTYCPKCVEYSYGLLNASTFEANRQTFSIKEINEVAMLVTKNSDIVLSESK